MGYITQKLGLLSCNSAIPERGTGN